MIGRTQARPPCGLLRRHGVPKKGLRGGTGWQNEAGDVRYTDEMAGGDRDAAWRG